jgi:hypothetical protein
MHVCNAYTRPSRYPVVFQVSPCSAECASPQRVVLVPPTEAGLASSLQRSRIERTALATGRLGAKVADKLGGIGSTTAKLGENG